MRSILEKALIALLNEEREKADALFHEFILERSRQIHESLRQGEDFVLDESWEKELAVDEMFTEADLFGEDEEEGDDDEQINEFDGDTADFDTEASDDTSDAADDADVDADADADVDSADDSAVDADVDAADDVDAEEGDIESRVDDIEAELQKLSAEFDALVAGEDDAIDAVRDDTEGGDFGNMDGDTDFGGDADADTDAGFGGDVDGEDDVEESFDDFLESVTSDLEKVSVKMVDGTEQGGGKITQNKKSPGLQPKLGDRALKGEPVQIKSTEHNGYDKEPAPKTKDMPKRQNTKAKAEDGRTKVSKEGDKSAMLNDLKTNKGDDKSIIGSGKAMGKI
jgi:hypothetical protein